MTQGRIAVRRRTRKVQSYSSGQVVLMCTHQRQINTKYFIGPSRVHIPNGTSSVQPFLRSRQRPEGANTLQWAAPFLPQKLPIRMGIWTSAASRLIHGSLGPPESTIVTDRPINRRTMNATTPSVTTGRIGLRSTAMRPNIICSID